MKGLISLSLSILAVTCLMFLATSCGGTGGSENSTIVNDSEKMTPANDRDSFFNGNLVVSGDLTVGGNLIVTGNLIMAGNRIDFVNENTSLISQSENTLATEKAIKAYIDSAIVGIDSLGELADTSVALPGSGYALVYDGSISVEKPIISDLVLDWPGMSDSSVETVTIGSVIVSASETESANVTSAKNLSLHNGTVEIVNDNVGSDETLIDTVIAADIATGAVTTSEILDGTIVSADLADSAVTSAKIVDGTIANADLAANAITTDKITADTIETENIATGIVTTTEILDGTIATVDIANDAVTTAALAGDTIQADDIATGNVTTTEILDGTIATADIANGAITSALLDSSLSVSDNLTVGDNLVISGNLIFGTNMVSAVHDDDGLTSNSATALVAQQAIKAYVDHSIASVTSTLSGLTDTSISGVGNGHILIYDGSDSWDSKAISGDISLDSAGYATFNADSVDTAHLGDIVISGANLETGSITTTEIVDGTIATADIANNSITSAKLDSALTINGHLVVDGLGLTFSPSANLHIAGNAIISSDITLGTENEYFDNLYVADITMLSSKRNSEFVDLDTIMKLKPVPYMWANPKNSYHAENLISLEVADALEEYNVIDPYVISAANIGVDSITSANVIDETITSSDLKKDKIIITGWVKEKTIPEPKQYEILFPVHIPPNEEIWIIEKPKKKNIPKGEKYPTQGQLMAKIKEKEVPMPLQHTDVKAKVSDFVSTVLVKQEFKNPWDVKIEAEYVFPLPQDAAVTDFVMVVGDRKIRGLIREKQEAQRIYQQARASGRKAAILTQERPNVFKQKVANIEPGKGINIEITYFNQMEYKNGYYEFVFPMVVGPRFNPAHTSNGIGAVSEDTRGTSGQATEVVYMKREESRNGHDISLEVDIRSGLELGDIVCPSHVVDINHESKKHSVVKIKATDNIPNRDFILRVKMASEKVRPSFVVNESRHGKTFALTLFPPEEKEKAERMPREMVFVVDCSGSMGGEPLRKAKQAILRCLKNLDEMDSFQIIRFSDTASSFGEAPLLATPENIQRGVEYTEALNSNGGTMMINGIRQALQFPPDYERIRIVSFMTDGYIGNENEIFSAIYHNIGEARIFSFGIGDSVNRHLLKGMASFGNGAATFIGLDDAIGEEVNRYYETLGKVSLANVSIDWGDLQVSDVYPRKIPDLIPGRPIVITGKIKGKGNHEVSIKGKMGRDYVRKDIAIDLTENVKKHEGITSIWARAKIRDLEYQQTYKRSVELRESIKATSLTYNLMCKYTAFLAVDSLETTEGDHGVSVAVPAHIPKGVRYETSVK